MPSSPATMHEATSKSSHGAGRYVGLRSSIRGLLATLLDVASQTQTHCYNLYLITIDDTPTFVVPNTVFGLSSALTHSMINTTNSTALLTQPSLKQLLKTTSHTVIFNWTNLLIFDLANQRQSSTEDIHNKPWRPIPSGRLTSNQIRYQLILTIPIVLAYNHFVLGVGLESCLLAVLTWIYNDLGGGDDNWVVRNLNIACAFGVYNMGSMKVAVSILAATAGRDSEYLPTVSSLGYCWTVMISFVIFTTMHVQDLKDVKGDAARGRRSAPIVLGRRASGWTIAIPVIFWAVVCPLFWGSPMWVAGVQGVVAGFVAWRCVGVGGEWRDRRTWQLWCAWTAMLYLIPPLSNE